MTLAIQSLPLEIAALRAELEAGLDALALPHTLATPLLAYLALLHRWNLTYNLTAVRDPRAMVSRHLLDSLTLQPFVQGITTLADLGTGPGLPGIPLAIANPQLQVTLVESNGKKARFLREALRHLEVPNGQVVQARIEAVDAPGAFAAITARALATLPEIVGWGGHLLAQNGRLLALKGALPVEEIAALPEDWTVASRHRLTVPGERGERHLIVVGRAERADKA